MRRGWSRAWRWVDGATIHATARVHPSARLAPGVVVEARARVGAGVVLGPGAVVGSSVSVGAGTSVGPHTSLQHCSIGGGCTLHAGVRIGADGFGFVPGTPAGAEQSWESQRLERIVGSVLEGDVLPVKKPQRRRVVVGRDVEVGAGSCIDRGSWRDTSIGAHTKMDNLVQVGHNVVIGVGCLLCADVALGGSATLGDYCVLGGKAAVADHVSVAAGTRVAACSGVTSHVDSPGTTIAGLPARPIALWRREVAWARRAAARKAGGAR